MMRILAVPAFSNQATNPYNALLYAAIEQAGVPVSELSPSTLLRPDHDILHLHWPEYLFSAPSIGRAVAQAIAFGIAVSQFRRHGVRIVLTIHNLGAHEPWHPRLEAWMWRWCIARLDGVIALSAGGYAAAVTWQRGIAGLPVFTIPHGHYRDAYPREITRAAARVELSLPQDAPVIVFIGAIRPYKNVPALVDAFLEQADRHWRLVIAGEAADESLGRCIRERAEADPRVQVHLQYVEPERIQVYLRAADLVVLPYTDILNSGSAVLALSFGCPVLVSDRGAMAELRSEVGDAWVRTYHGELTATTLYGAVQWATSRDRETEPPLSDRDWDSVACRTVDAYRQLVDRPTVARRPTGCPGVGSLIKRWPRSVRQTGDSRG